MPFSFVDSLCRTTCWQWQQAGCFASRKPENLVRLLAQQKNADRFLIVEASERSQVWNLQAVRECTKTLVQTTHQWCHYETVLEQGEMPCSSKIHLLTNFHVADGSECRCGPVQHVKSREIGSRATARFEHVLRTVMHQVCLSNVSSGAPSQMPAKGQPELPSNANSKHVLTEDLNTDAEGLKKALRFGSLHAVLKFDHVNTKHVLPKHQSKSSFDSQRDFWISHGKHGLVRVHVEPRNSMYVPQDDECPVALHALESQRQTKLQQCISSLFQQPPPILVDDDWRTALSTDMCFHWVRTTSFTIKL